ncbi:phosphonate C-P lyase system protein PhnH [Derxia lacustris]|uniref:phosphonate C-P lyase system protein PhnH n=1 Tax=Derxia lacustris TaxID=764842 RepID=UPI000A16E210|nr:phosphonate C-P lyase system protein PhnH [Derxia lacustris]
MNAATLDLARLAPGFADPVHDAQAVFRRLLDATARPGRVQTLPATVERRLGRPAGAGPALAATALTLLDGQTRLWLAPALADAADWCRFHTGARIAADAGGADFAFAPADAVDAALWQTLSAGSDAAPQDSATLVVEVPALDAAPGALGLRLTGPGIADEQRLAVAGLPREFWLARIADQAGYPRGADLLLMCGTRLAAVPRSTRIALED